jgi:hypothetical protein
MRILLLLGLVSCALSAQRVSIGVKAGIPITDILNTADGPFSSSYVVNNHPYLVGGTIQLNLPARFSIEVDGLYRRLGYRHDFLPGAPPSPVPFASRTTANSWEFPVLGKLAILPGPIRPFVDAGANFRRVTGAEQIGGLGPGVPGELAEDFTAGFTFGGGIELKLGRVRITPELRYTHWGTESFRDSVNSILHTNLNQGDFVLGLTF